MPNWNEHCKICNEETEHRFLDCEVCKAEGKDCNMVICRKCGVGYERK